MSTGLPSLFTLWSASKSLSSSARSAPSSGTKTIPSAAFVISSRFFSPWLVSIFAKIFIFLALLDSRNSLVFWICSAEFAQARAKTWAPYSNPQRISFLSLSFSSWASESSPSNQILSKWINSLPFASITSVSTISSYAFKTLNTIQLCWA